MTKVISLSEMAYQRLARFKGKASFSEAVMELTTSVQKPQLLEVIRRMKADEQLATNVERIYKTRKNLQLKKVKLE